MNCGYRLPQWRTAQSPVRGGAYKDETNSGPCVDLYQKTRTTVACAVG
ncbi:hypothetical protein K3495_g13601 [Podosphaera aphanis]|nr:hypothetical protein K3495_g13601 [Podosphaera aphanis]